jgi:hypothetical protein
MWILAPFTLARTSGSHREQVVGAIEKQFGVTPGQRRNHINGVCVSGTFMGIKIFRHIQILYCFQAKIYQLLEDSQQGVA